MAELPRDVPGDDDHARRPPRKRGRRRRLTIPLMTAADDARVDSEVRETTKNSRADKTLTVYKGCMTIIAEWYSKNQPALCTVDGVVDAEK